MSEPENRVDHEMHKKLAIDLFNRVWGLLDKPERTTEEDDEMVHAAHASRFHWGEIGTPLEFERGEWQISRVYSVLNRPEAALHHARSCLEICEANGIVGFDIAFAYEALARAHAAAGNHAKAQEFADLAERAAAAIEDAGNREYTLREVAAVKEML